MVKTIDYKLKSNAWEIVQLPQEYAERAEKLIQDISKAKSGGDLVKIAKEHPYMAQSDIIGPISEFLYPSDGGARSLFMHDLILLNVSLSCINRGYNDSMSQLKEEYNKAQTTLDETYKSFAVPIMKSLEGIHSKIGEK